MPVKKWNINTCTAKDLCEEIPHLSHTIAARIVASRNRKHGYSSLDEVRKIRGVSQEISEDLQKYFRVTDASASSRRSSVRRTPRKAILVVKENSEHWITPAATRNDTKRKQRLRRSAEKRKAETKPTTRSASTGNRSQSEKPKTRSSRYPTNPNDSIKNKSVPESRMRTRSAAGSRQKSQNTHQKPRSTASIKPRAPKNKVAKSAKSKKGQKSRATSQKKSPTKGEASTIVSGTKRAKPSVISGGREKTTARVDNCSVAVHSDPKCQRLRGQQSPIVTVDISPTAPISGLEYDREKRGTSPVALRRSMRRSPSRSSKSPSPVKRPLATTSYGVEERSTGLRRSPARHSVTRRGQSPSPERHTSPQSLRLRPTSQYALTRSRPRTISRSKSPIRSPAFPQDEDLTLKRTLNKSPKEAKLPVSESLDELLASSNRDATQIRSDRTGRSRTSSAKVSQWLEKNSACSFSRRSNLKNSARSSTGYPFSRSSPMRRRGNSCKRALESDFEKTVHEPYDRHPRHPKRSRADPEPEMCSCGICKRCGKPKTPKSERRRRSRQSNTHEPAMTWCNLL